MEMHLCRTCMSRNDLSPLFGELSAVKFTSKQLFLVTGIKIKKNDGLPQSACKTCIKRISKTFEFREISRKVDQLLRKLLNMTIKSEQKDAKNIEIDDNLFNNIDNDSWDSINITENDNCNDLSCLDDVDDEINDRCPLKIEKNDNAIDDSIPLSKVKDFYDEMKSQLLKFDNATETSIVKRKSTRNKVKAEKVKSNTDVKVNKHTRNRRKNNENMSKEEIQILIKKRDDLVKKRERKKKLMSLAVTPHPDRGPIQCKICFKTLKNCSSFRSHAATHYEPEFPCQHCDKKFHGGAHLRYHQERKHGRKKRLGCDKCDFRAVDRMALLNHVRAAHTGERPYVCDECGAAFRMRNNLKQHLPKHYGVKNMQCELCPKRFILRSELWGHQMKVHYMTYTYNCYLCTETYKTRMGVRNHILKLHGVPLDEQPIIKFVKTRKLDCPPIPLDDHPS